MHTYDRIYPHRTHTGKTIGLTSSPHHHHRRRHPLTLLACARSHVVVVVAFYRHLKQQHTDTDTRCFTNAWLHPGEPVADANTQTHAHTMDVLC